MGHGITLSTRDFSDNLVEASMATLFHSGFAPLCPGQGSGKEGSNASADWDDDFNHAITLA
jgi:hypothetical protein